MKLIPGNAVRAAGMAAALILCCVLSPALARADGPAWVAVWGSSQMRPDAANALPLAVLKDATLRQVVRLSAGGTRLRVRLSNAFGTSPLHVSAAAIARPVAPVGAEIDVSSERAILFNGRPDVIIPAGADYLSDPVDYDAPALASVAVSLHLLDAGAAQTSHPGARATSFIVAGDQVSAATLTDETRVDHWYFLAGVEASGPATTAAVVLLGDSIIDGYGVPADSNARWSDHLAERVQANPTTSGVAVVNQGIGGNRLLADGLGPNASARLERDVFSPAGVRYVLVLEGVNDLGVLTRDTAVSVEAHAAIVRQMIGAYQQIILRARERGVRAIGGTIMPFAGSAYYHPGAETEADRQAVNDWIRAPGHFDAVVDFDRIMGDPLRPDHLNPAYDSGDGLHPSMAGYRAMGDAVPLDLFKEDAR